MNRFSIKKIAASCVILSAPLAMFAQSEEPELSKTIQVYSEYKPQISDAARISVNPKVYDTLDLQVNLKYNIATTPLQTDYHIIPLRAVSVKGDKLQELYRGEATIGLGNYWNNLFSLRYMTERSRLRQAGVELYHNGSAGKLKIQDEKVPAGYTTDYFSAYWKRFYENFTLYASIKPGYQNFMRYGYYTYNANDTVDYGDKKDIRRNIITLDANAGLVSNDTDVDALRYNADVNYGLTVATNPTNIENAAVLSGGLNKLFGRVVAGFDANYKLSALNFETKNDSAKFQSLLQVMPYAKVGTDDWTLQVGVKASPLLGSETIFKIFPDLAFEYSIPKVKIIPYFNLYGGVDMMTMREMLDENPYASDSIMIRPTVNKLGFDFGIKGRIKKLITYNAEFTVKAYEGMYFWEANRNCSITNRMPIKDAKTTFNVIYDENTTLMKGHLDLGFLFRKVTCGIEANYYYWQLDTIKYAWYKPVTDVTFSSRFLILNPNNNKTKLSVEPNMYLLVYRNETMGEGDIANNCIFDLGIEANYYYNSVLRIFLDVNNLLGIKNYRFVDYPCQRANFMAGLSYSFGGHKE
ncbi:MAG: hypothetical protein MJ197_01095 [Bacteroidales bacterium]|nr:hypothetical protein [Bacteroidales bacterium]